MITTCLRDRLSRALIGLAMGLTSVTAPALAVMPDEVLADPTLEARARTLSQDLRGLVCQNQSIDDSAAPLARDLRIIVRERLSQGDSDEQVIDYLVTRYGNYVLLKPPLQTDTLLLWLGPGIIVLIAGAVFAAYVRRRPKTDGDAPPPLTEDERRELAALIKDQ
jgi:cytochrome c-type biogenesis protein CcmH